MNASDDMCLIKEKDDKSSSSSFEKILSFEESSEEHKDNIDSSLNMIIYNQDDSKNP
jgi:hypothetical protein